MSPTDWQAWHAAYDDPASALSERLRTVQRHVDGYLDATAPRPVRVVSACAGDGRDLLGVLERRRDARRVSATLLEADPVLAARAQERASRLGLAGLEVGVGDAGVTDAFLGAVPADLVMLCGIFGNISDDDVRRTVEAAGAMCTPDARVIWTRHLKEPDLTPRIREWFGGSGFVEEAFDSSDIGLTAVGVHRRTGGPEVLEPGRRLFRFVR